jgi:hypothetical protein
VWLLPDVIAHDAVALDSCLAWYGCARDEAVSRSSAPEQHCATRDVFEARLSRVLRRCERHGHPAHEAALLVAVLGEIGNNSFDHNLGHWPDEPGCFFTCTVTADPLALAWVADRGRGVLASLRQAVPALADHQSALEMAFEKILSGRHPERRGNGLKFVRRVINGHDRRALVAVSATGKVGFGGSLPSLEPLRTWPLRNDLGTLAVVAWRFS